MDFSYIQDDRWKDLDEADQARMISLGFDQEVASDPRFQDLEASDQQAMSQMYQAQAQEASAQVMAPDTSAGTTPGDYSRLLAAGLNRFGQTVGRGIDVIGNIDPTRLVTDSGEGVLDVVGQGIEKYYTKEEQKDLANLSPAMQEAQKLRYTTDVSESWLDAPLKNFKSIFSGEAWKSPAKVVGSLAQSAPTTAVGMGTGAAFTNGLIKLGVSSGLAGVIGGFLGEGSTASVESGKEIYDMVLTAPQEVISKTPEYQKAWEALADEQLTDLDRDRQTRELIADHAAIKSMVTVFTATGLLGSVSGHYTGKLLGGEATGGITKRALTGGGLETLQEIPQSGYEVLEKNIQNKKYVNPEQDIWADVKESSTAGGVQGFAMGLGMSGGIASLGKPQVDTTKPSETIQAAPTATEAVAAAEEEIDSILAPETIGPEAEQFEDFMAAELARQPIVMPRTTPKVPVDMTTGYERTYEDPKVKPIITPRVPVQTEPTEPVVPINVPEAQPAPLPEPVEPTAPIMPAPIEPLAEPVAPVLEEPIEPIAPEVVEPVVEPLPPPPPPPAPTPEADRRQNVELRKRIADMTLEEAQIALKTDDLTGLGNRRAYDEADKKPVQSSIDVDSLKFINDEFGHEAGDELLQIVGEALQQTNLEAFHISGDEYVIHGETAQEVADNVEVARTYLDENPLVLVDNNGKVVAEVKGTFSYGTGETYKAADAALAEDKTAREAAGERAARGEEPKGVKRFISGKQIDTQEGLAVTEREEIGDLLDSRITNIQELAEPNDTDQGMLKKLLQWQKALKDKTATDKELLGWQEEISTDIIRAQKEQSVKKTPQFQAGEYAPGEGVTLEDIQAQFPGQQVFVSPNKEVSVVFKNGQGITITQIKDFEDGDKEIAFESGQMGPEGIIFGMTEGNKITLNKDFADPETLAHEMTHTLKNLGILTPKDENILFLELNRLTQKDKFRYDRSKMTDLGAARDEDLANVLAQVLTDRKSYAGTRLGKIIQKIMDFVDSLMAMGKQTTTKLAKEFENGDIFSRTPEKKTTKDSNVPMFQTSSDRQSQPFDMPEGSTRGETAKYAIIDVLDPVKKVQAAIGEDKITEKEDYLLKERLRRNQQGEKIAKAEKTLAKPIVDLMAENNFNTDQVDEALYGRHAIEANKRLKLTNARRFLAELAETNEKDYLQEKIDAIDKDMKEADLPNAARQTAYLELLDKELQYTVSADTKAIKKEWQTKSPMFSGITDDQAKKINADWADDKAMQSIMKLTDKITKATIQVSLDSGRITQDEADAFRSTFKHYVPLFREGHTTQSGLFGTGQGIVNLGKDYKIRGGSSARAVNMLTNVLIQHEQAIRRAGKAEAGRTFLNLVKANPNKKFWKISEKTLINAYDEHGNIYKKDDYKIEPNDIPLKIDGKYYIISMNVDNVHATRIAQHLKGSDVQTGWLVRGLSRFNRVLANVYTGLNPEFILTNPVRDIQIAAVNLSSTEIKDLTMKVLKDVPKAFMGVRDAIRGDATTKWGKIAKEAQEAGMMMSWSEQGQDVEKLAKNINRDVRLQQKDLGANVARTTMKIGKLIKDYNMIAENMTRLAAYKWARTPVAEGGAGMSEAKSALLGKELTVNFEQKGLYGEIYNSLYLFSSAGVQGSTRLISGLVKSPKARKMVGGLMLSAMGVAITNGLIGGDDEEGKNNYAAVNAYDKERNMIFVVPNSGGKLIKIPLGWGLNFFWNIGTELGDAALAAMEPSKFKYDALDGASRLLNAGLNAFNPIQSATLAQAISPTITDPVVQVAENKSFSGAPLMPEQNKFAPVPTPDSQRYWKTVRPTSKVAAEWINSITGGDKVEKGLADVSPETLDMIFDTYTGGLGKFLEGMWKLPQTLSEPEIDIKKIPVARRFVGTTSKTKGRQEFYSNAKEVKTLLKKIKTYPERRRELQKDPLFRLSAQLKSTERQINALRKILKRAKSERSKQRLNDRIKKLQNKFNDRFEKRINK